MYSKDTSTLLLTLELSYKPLGIFRRAIQNYFQLFSVKVLWSIFNYSVKKLSNLESSFSNSATSWKNKTPTISTKTLRMKIYLSKAFLQTQSFFIVWNQKQMIFVLEKTGSRDRKLLNFKRSSKTFPQDTKAIWNSIYPQ